MEIRVIRKPNVYHLTLYTIIRLTLRPYLPYHLILRTCVGRSTLSGTERGKALGVSAGSAAQITSAMSSARAKGHLQNTRKGPAETIEGSLMFVSSEGVVGDTERHTQLSEAVGGRCSVCAWFAMLISFSLGNRPDNSPSQRFQPHTLGLTF